MNTVERTREQVETSMRTSPMKWAGIAAGAGFGLGLVGRLLQLRKKRRLRNMPDLIIIDSTTC